MDEVCRECVDTGRDWRRTLLYNYPEPAQRPLSWLAAHIVHELVHHRADIERLAGSS